LISAGGWKIIIGSSWYVGEEESAGQLPSDRTGFEGDLSAEELRVAEAGKEVQHAVMEGFVHLFLRSFKSR